MYSYPSMTTASPALLTNPM